MACTWGHAGLTVTKMMTGKPTMAHRPLRSKTEGGIREIRNPEDAESNMQTGVFRGLAVEAAVVAVTETRIETTLKTIAHLPRTMDALDRIQVRTDGRTPGIMYARETQVATTGMADVGQRNRIVRAKVIGGRTRGTRFPNIDVMKELLVIIQTMGAPDTTLVPIGQIRKSTEIANLREDAAGAIFV